MTDPIRFAIVLVAFCAISTGAGAAKVYKCGNTYSQVPCPDGVELNTASGPTAAQQRAAQKETREVAKAAEQLAKERKAEERALAKSQQEAEKARKAAVAAEAKEAAAATKKQEKGTFYFTAKAPATKASQPK